MTFRVHDGHGAHALDINQQLARLLGRGVISGGVVTAAGTADDPYHVTVEATEVYLNGQHHVLTQTDLDLTSYLDDLHPRKALIYVDTTGALAVAPGEAEEATPRDQFRFDCYRPAPPDLHYTDAVVLAEVWLDPDDYGFTDADIRDRRLSADLDIYSVTADTLDVSTLIDGAGVSHTGELAGSEAIQTEAEIRDAINSDTTHGTSAPHSYFSGSHDDLTNVSPEDHHARYTDVEARTAVEGTVDAADLTGATGTAGQHIEYTGTDVVWSDPPGQTASPIASGTVTHTGGSATTVLLAGVTTDETAQFEIAVGVNTAPTWSGDYAYSVDVSRQWDDVNATLNVELTLSWETDPGAGNDLSLAWTAFETSPVVVQGRYTDADAIAALNGADISPASIDVLNRFNGPVYDDISTITGMEQGDFAIASGAGVSEFGQYLYDGTAWKGPLGTSVSTLSELTIDTAKDWAGYAISNVGAPAAATDVARQQELDDHTAVANAHHAKTTSADIDHSLISNVQPDQHHARYTDAEAIEAVAGRAITSTLTGASIPNSESLQNFHHLDTNEEMVLIRGELSNEDGLVPDGLSLQVVDKQTETVAFAQSSTVMQGSLASPMATVSGAGMYSIRILNETGKEVAASGSMNFVINQTV